MESVYSELKWQEKNVSLALSLPPCCEARHEVPCSGPRVRLAGGEQYVCHRP